MGYGIPDTAWLTLADLDVLTEKPEEIGMVLAGETDAAFTL